LRCGSVTGPSFSSGGVSSGKSSPSFSPGPIGVLAGGVVVPCGEDRGGAGMLAGDVEDVLGCVDMGQGFRGRVDAQRSIAASPSWS
jgi:hypothetical protein